VKKLVMLVGSYLAACLAACLVLGGLSGLLGPAPTASASDSSSTPAFTHTETVSRTFWSDNQPTTVDSRSVTLNVDDTTNLQGRQEIAVSWSGAHPTGGIVSDPNSIAGENQEYPMVLLECRGTASGADEVTPETCWTQDSGSRYQDSYDDNADGSWPSYRLDHDATTPGAAIVGQPVDLPAGQFGDCQSEETGAIAAPVQYWVPWLAADGTVYDGGLGGVCGEPPEATNVGGSALPSNETYGVTAVDGTGHTEFDVFNSTENATLGCSQTVTCSLVAVPVMGIDCDADLLGASPTTADLSALADCENTGYYQPGAPQSGQGDNLNELTVSGSLWWSPSNWQDRITVPLTFAPPPNACSLVGSSNVVDVYGSELMLQATGQWEPNFCLSDTDNFSFIHVPEGEPEARDDVATGSASAAFTSYAQPGGYGKPVVNAPVAVTGFTIAFSVDGTNGDPISQLNLTPLLLAKLLTNSYPDISQDEGGDPALAQNPLNITQDPEFIALNPGIPQLGAGSAAAAELASVSEDSDVMEGLTTYINDDPVARAFLNGTPDTSMPGEDMVVNPAYKGIQLPVDQWPLLSTYQSTSFDGSPTVNNCLQSTPVAFDTLLAAPLGSLEDISEDAQFAKANSTLTCSPNEPGVPNSLVANGTEAPGHYFVLGITPLADDARYDLQTASLQTTTGTFVAPSNASLEATTSLLQPDPSSGTWPVPYGQFDSAVGSAAYPGTMVVYAAVPTSGLPPTAAADYAALLTFAVGPGQTPGEGVGQLPPGYLPLTAADDLGGLVAYTQAAAADVAAQNGQVPPLTPAAGSSAGSGSSASAGSAPFDASAFGGNGQFVSGLFGSAANSVDGATSAAAKAEAAKANAAKIPFIRLPGLADTALWIGGVPVGFILILALLVALTAVTTLFLGRRRRRW
jgi:hypothetical protein